MEETWKDIKNYQGIYQISSFGKIKNNKGKILKQFKNHKGYLVIQLSKNGDSKNYIVHRLVAKEFIPNPENKPQINHKNCNKEDNRIDNLEWCTNTENKAHAKIHGLCKSSPKGGSNLRAKKVIQYDKEGRIVRKWDCIQDIVRCFKIATGSNISGCCKHKLKTAYGYKWEYEVDINARINKKM